MALVKILFDPVPVGRLGVVKKTREMVFVKDFSCFQWLLEEYIAHGAVSIVIPSSSPESLTVEKMPGLLSRRIEVVDDQKEEETVERIFYRIFKELGVTFNPINRSYYLPRTLTRDLAEAIESAHANTKRLMFAYNHRMQTEVNIEHAVWAFRLVRESVQDTESKLVMAQLEGLLRHYEQATFEACLPTGSKQIELITAFDQLANDKDYLSYSSEISNLDDPRTRDTALFRLRALSRRVSSKECVGVVWDYITKTVRVCTGVLLPESKELACFTNEKPLPTFITMRGARERAVSNWIKTGATQTPCARGGHSIASGDDLIHWLPPMQGKLIMQNDGEYRLAESVNQMLDVLNRYIESSEGEVRPFTEE